MRGEYPVGFFPHPALRELPPRARRILLSWLKLSFVVGTTSACAENTGGHGDGSTVAWNYLRVRGEYRYNHGPVSAQSELPPRARRIPLKGVKNAVDRGTTSACAENTIMALTGCFSTRNYLRVRGEYIDDTVFLELLTELPPRARRILAFPHSLIYHRGTTSACAENTYSDENRRKTAGNYLRVRGEYIRTCKPRHALLELPPRARRIHKIS